MTVAGIIAVILIAASGWGAAIYLAVAYYRSIDDWADFVGQIVKDWVKHCEELNDSWAADYEGLEDRVREETRLECYKEFSKLPREGPTIQGRRARIVPLRVTRVVDLCKLSYMNLSDVTDELTRHMAQELVKSLLNVAIIRQQDDPVWGARHYEMTVYVAVPEEADANENTED